MRSNLSKFLFISISVICLSSCVAKRKYLSQRNLADQQQKEIASLNKMNTALNDSITVLTNAILNLRDKVGELGYENKIASSQLNMTREQIASQRKKLQQMQDLMAQQQRATADLRKMIGDALTGFNSNELTIDMKNGKLYISMQENLLFPSGSAKVNPKGKQALSKVANVLNSNHDININIEGHTDSIAIHNKTYVDNWALSDARATSIARVLTDEYLVSPTRLVASGRSFYDPAGPNTSPEGRSMNRRTEIILEPKLDELFQLMSNN